MKKKVVRGCAVLLVIGLSGFMMAGACDDVKDACGLSCPEQGIAEGNASITGVASIDGFFGAVVNYSSKANLVAGGIDAELAAIAASVDLDGGADADFGGGFQAAVQAKFDLAGDISIDFQPPKCEVSAKASIEATAKCDASVDPGSVEASCEGKCEVDPGEVNLEAACEGSAEASLTCTGTAPNLQCEGTCTGTCELSAAASCEGTCNGTCNGTCSVENASGQCAGECDGTCEGSCELEAGGSCSGSCTGSCEYTPPSAECEAGAKAEIECHAEASAEPPKVNCSGSCSGEVTPPSASAECEASAKAEAEINAECHPPSVGVSYEFAAGADADAQIAFKAWLSGFKAHMSALAAANARADIVLKAGAGILDAAGNVITNAASEIDLAGDPIGSFRVAECLSAELGDVGPAINGATGNLTASAQASASLMGSLGM
jgi:hypothetical protein